MDDITLYSHATVGEWHFPDGGDCTLWEFCAIGSGSIEVYEHRPNGEIVQHEPIGNHDITDLTGHVVRHALESGVIALRDRWVDARNEAVASITEHPGADDSTRGQTLALNRKANDLRAEYRRKAGF